MSIHPDSLKNLRPIQPGERRAAKPKHRQATANINIRVTESERERLRNAAASKNQTLTRYLLDGK